MAEFAALLAKQTSNMNFVSRFWENCNRTGKAKQTAAFFEARMRLLDQYFDVCLSTHNQLNELATTAELKNSPYFKDGRIYDVEQEYCETSGLINALLSENKGEDGSKRTPGIGVTRAGTANENIESSVDVYRLPTITLPKFSGKYTEWASFRDLFQAVIHNNKALSDVQRLHYLKTNLTGEAEAMLRHISIDAANYESALETLKTRYENTRLIVTTQLKQLAALPAVGNESSVAVKRLLDGTMEVVQALKNLGRPVDHWDDWLVFVTTQKLDTISHKEWEVKIGSSKELPTFEQLREFLEQRIGVLEAIDVSNRKAQPSKSTKSEIKSHVVNAETTIKCRFCEKRHSIAQCYNFKRQNVGQRREYVAKLNLCFNCLRDGHQAINCLSQSRCRTCDRAHHSLLHLSESAANTQSSPTPNRANKNNDTPVAVATNVIQQRTCHQVLLATAQVPVTGPWGTATLRILVDQGSQATLITENVVQNLRLPRRKMLVRITGVGNSEAGESKGAVSLKLGSKTDPNFTITADAFVVSKLTAVTPTLPVKQGNWSHLQSIFLADPDYHEPGRIDMIIGADLYGLIVKDGILKGEPDQPVAINTCFGWILSGPTHNVVNSPTVNVHQVMVSNEILATQLRQFWELQEVATPSVLSDEEKECEKHFTVTHRRDANGRYIVRLPKKAVFVLGESRLIATRQLQRLEKRLLQNSYLDQQYRNFLHEYEQLDHMQQICAGQHVDQSFYLPHHCVIKDQSTSTKLRVVFNASQSSTNGKSLNDLLYVGPKLQQDLSTIILRWRQYCIVFAADIEKMYRQIRVADEDTHLQRILWRRSPIDEISEFRLTTVTYGTSCAPFLAIRTLLQLAEDEKVKYPLASRATRRDFYVDDILSGADTEAEALTLQNELMQMLQAGGFTLKKWISNCDRLLEVLPPDHREQTIPLALNTVDVKTLGLRWHPVKDVFSFEINLSPRGTLSKRTILSDIAGLYDPLGWLSPTIITAKIMLQRLWALGIDWDATIPSEIEIEWTQYRQLFSELSKIEINRWTGYQSTKHKIQLHAFCDASIRAYAAAVFVRVEDDFGNVQVTLLTAKSKVAPIKAVSLPRLELCGAVLLVRLLNTVRQAMDMQFDGVYAWTDSTIVLCWLRKEPRTWKTFICNRVAEIQQSTEYDRWNHVASGDNPADVATRGIAPDLLKEFRLWWSGPDWLKQRSSEWPQNFDFGNNIVIDDQQLEYAGKVRAHVTILPWDLLSQHSSFTKLLRITAWCKRFIFNCRTKPDVRLNGYLTASEINTAERFWIEHTQAINFATDIANLRNNRCVPGNRLRALSPFIDHDGLIRVGGRLQQSALSYNEKHPIVLCKSSHFSTLIIDNAHKSTLHGGLELTIRYIRQRYWILNVREQVKKRLRKCIICFKQNARVSQQMMSDLPRPRAVPSRPFLHVGLDYAGPINVRLRKGRGQKSHKAWIALFICFASKAVHIELVNDYTTQAFIAAFKRFTSRRGVCSDIYSDCGTNFTGAAVKLKADRQQASKMHHKEVGSFLAMQSINWHFNPPSAPHFGGLWESNIKSVKSHLKKVIGNSTLTSEEMLTVLAQIEAALNSRPLHPMSSDPNDVAALTPSHFLIGEPLLAVPEPNVLDCNENRLTRWQLVQQLQQHFWSRWSQDYLRTLQQRSKWLKPQPSVEKGALVLIKDERLPPNQWPLGRVVEVHPGADKLVRVASVKCKDKIIQRPVVKLAVLPLATDPIV